VNLFSPSSMVEYPLYNLQGSSLEQLRHREQLFWLSKGICWLFVKIYLQYLNTHTSVPDSTKIVPGQPISCRTLAVRGGHGATSSGDGRYSSEKMTQNKKHCSLSKGILSMWTCSFYQLTDLLALGVPDVISWSTVAISRSDWYTWWCQIADSRHYIICSVAVARPTTREEAFFQRERQGR
jgi:hypothetical protein